MARVPLSVCDVWNDGPPLRLWTLAAIAGWSHDKVRSDVLLGLLVATRQSGKAKAPYLIARHEARRWLLSLGIAPTTNDTYDRPRHPLHAA